MVVSGTHLSVEHILHEIPERHLFIQCSSWLCHSLAFLVGQRLMVGPLAECRCPVEVAIVAECGVRHEPLLVVVEESLVGDFLAQRSLFLREHFLQVFHLCCEHPLVVNLRQGVQFLLQGCEMLAACLVLQFRKLSEVGILWVKGIDAYAVVRI